MPEQVRDSEAEEMYRELGKFFNLALKANPNILRCLYTPLAQALLDQREICLSQRIYQTYNGYVISQFKRLEQDLRTTGALKWKHAMHLIRLLLTGIRALRKGSIPVHVGQQREALLAIRRGEVAWAEINSWRFALHNEFDAAFARTRLPQYPNYEAADDFLVRAHRSMVR